MSCKICTGEIAIPKKNTINKQEFKDKVFAKIHEMRQKAEYYRHNHCNRLHEEYVVKQSTYADCLKMIKGAESKAELLEKARKATYDNHGYEIAVRNGMVQIGKLIYAKHSVFYEFMYLVDMELEDFK